MSITSGEVCCPNKEQNSISVGTGESCCQGIPYSTSGNQICCGRSLHDGFNHQCCGGEIVSKDLICCGDEEKGTVHRSAPGKLLKYLCNKLCVLLIVTEASLEQSSFVNLGTLLWFLCIPLGASC